MTTYAKALERLTADLSGDISKLTPAQQAERRAQRLTAGKAPLLDTPWGIADHIHPIGPGIARVSTPSHGGYLVDRDKVAAMPSPLHTIVTRNGEGWYEEDLDWAIVALAYSHMFTPRMVYHAVGASRYQRSGWYAQAVEFLQTPAGKVVQAVADTWLSVNGHLYEAGSMGTMGKGWTVWYSRIDGKGPRYSVLHQEYPSRDDLLTEDQLKALGGKIIEL